MLAEVCGYFGNLYTSYAVLSSNCRQSFRQWLHLYPTTIKQNTCTVCIFQWCVFESRIHMSPVELRMKRVSAQTQWWTAGSPLVSWTPQHNKMLSSSSACSHCRRSSHSLFTSTLHWLAMKHKTCTDCSSPTADNKEPFSKSMVPQADHQMFQSYSPWFCSWMVFSMQTAGYSHSQSKETLEGPSASTSSSFSSPWDPTANRRKLLSPRPWAKTSSQEKLGTEQNRSFYSVKENIVTDVRKLVLWCVYVP